MKSIQKNNIIKWAMLLFSCAILMPVFVACDDDDKINEPTDKYVKLGHRFSNAQGEIKEEMLPEDHALTLSKDKSSKYEYFVKTNVKSWSISAQGEGVVDWVNIWPNTGSEDGRFTFSINENKTLEERKANLVLTASDGKEFPLFDITQAQSARAIWLTPSSKTIPSKATTLAFKVESTTDGWDVVAYDENIVIESIDKEEGMVIFSVSANDADDAVERQLKIFINSADLPIIESVYTLTQKYPGQK